MSSVPHEEVEADDSLEDVKDSEENKVSSTSDVKSM